MAARVNSYPYIVHEIVAEIERVKGLCTNCRENNEIQIVAMSGTSRHRTGPSARPASNGGVRRRGGDEGVPPRTEVPPPPPPLAPPPAGLALAAAAQAAERAEAARRAPPPPEPRQPEQAQGEEDLSVDVHEAALNLSRREADNAKAKANAFGVYECSHVSAIISI